jgi:hypothetical protein
VYPLIKESNCGLDRYWVFQETFVKALYRKGSAESVLFRDEKKVFVLEFVDDEEVRHTVPLSHHHDIVTCVSLMNKVDSASKQASGLTTFLDRTW